MKILVLGSGGREHALVWKLAQSPHAGRIWCAPGNGGTSAERLLNGSAVENVPVAADDIEGLLTFARDVRPDLTVVGPDNLLALGVVDRFQAAGFRIWGPNQSAARFESSKAFSQDFMLRHGIPSPRAGTFTDRDAAVRFCEEFDGHCAIKADGLALGKGVILSNSAEEAAQAIDQMLLKGAFGDAGKTVVIQELVEGPEISLHALCDGTTARLFPTAQDHKRIFDEDKGPNTGGMGTYSPTPFLNDAELASIGNQILGPWISGCRAEGLDFRGLLYPGVILTKSGPRVLEFNARFGDPETQVYMTRLKSDLVEILNASVDGTLDRCELSWSVEPSVCVVVASRGYPASSTKGSIIHGLPQAAGLPGVKVFHAGTARHGSDWVTNGGRVLGVTATGANLLAARDAAYAAVETICFEGMQFRRDIAEKGIRAYALR